MSWPIIEHKRFIYGVRGGGDCPGANVRDSSFIALIRTTQFGISNFMVIIFGKWAYSELIFISTFDYNEHDYQ